MRAIDIIMSKKFGRGKKGMVIGWPELLKVAGGTATDIVGATPPITLADAIKGKITKLTQYGLCTQADTPTPSAPVPIICNNGALTMVDDELPAGYKRVLGFKCNNNAMWEIEGFKLRGSDTVRISFSVDAACNVWGCYQGTDATDNYDLYASVSSGAKYLRYGDGTYLSYWSNSNLGVRFDVVYTPTGTTGMPQDSTWTPKSFTSANDLLIGSTTVGGTSSKMKGNLYGTIEVDGRLKLIPCERVSDNVLGYYDTYSETFYEPYTGFTGAVSLGYDGSHYTLAVVGTDEAISVRGKNIYNAATRVEGYYLAAGGYPVEKDVCAYSAAIPVEYNKTYTFSGISSEEGSNKKRILFYRTDEATTALSSPNPAEVEGVGVPWTLTFTITNSNCKFIRASFNLNDANVQIEEGSAKTAYAPYAEQTATAPDLFAVGDYADEAEIISGGVTRRIGWHIFDGTETFGKSSAYGAAFYIQSAANVWGAQRKIVMCSHYLGLATATSTTEVDTCFFNASGHFYIRVTDNSDTAAFKAWLKEQYAAGTPVIVLFVLAEETTESVTPQPLNTTAGDNVISVTANVSPIEFDVTYMKGAA